MTPRESALIAARIAIYGSADAHTPAQYTCREALQKMEVERPKAKRRKWEKEEKEESE